MNGTHYERADARARASNAKHTPQNLWKISKSKRPKPGIRIGKGLIKINVSGRCKGCLGGVSGSLGSVLGDLEAS